MLPAAAQAQYPYDWHAATPPSWFAESIDSSCQVSEQYTETVSGDARTWSLGWARNSEGNSCFKPIPFNSELGAGVGFYCRGSVSHYQADDSPDGYQAVWSCSVGDATYGAICERNSHYEERPLGDPNESYNYDSGGWYDPYTGGPYDCRPEESADGGDESGDNSACERAKQKVKKAKKKVRQADTRAEKTKAKNKLKKAKQKKKEACA